MTSTVLDVTVFLLCVSASVGTLLTGGPTALGDTPDARATADRIATVTGTVSFTVASEDQRRRRRHQATLSMLLANAVLISGTDESTPRGSSPGAGGVPPDADEAPPEADEAPPDDSGDRTTYTAAVVDLVGDSISPRTRVVARSEERSADLVVGPKPPRDAPVAVAAFSVPAGPESEDVRMVVQRWSHA